MAIGTSIIDLSKVKAGDFLRVESGHSLRILTVVKQDSHFLIGFEGQYGAVIPMLYDQQGQPAGDDQHRWDWAVIYQTVLDPVLHPDGGKTKLWGYSLYEGGKYEFNAACELEQQLHEADILVNASLILLSHPEKVLKVHSIHDVAIVLELYSNGYDINKLEALSGVVEELRDMYWHEVAGQANTGLLDNQQC